MTMRVTITGQNVFSPYGVSLPVGSIQTVDSQYGQSLVYSLRATDTDGVLSAAPNPPFASNAINVSSAISLAVKKHPFMPAGFANVQKVMATPPTVAISTVNPLAAGQFFAATNNSGANQFVDLSAFAVSCAGNPVVAGLTNPNPNYVNWQCVSAGSGATIGSYFGANMVKIRVVFSSAAATPAIVLGCKGLTGNILAKVNDQYTSLTPTVIGNTGVTNFFSLTFAAPGTWTIEFIADDVVNSFYFMGMWIATGDTLMPAQIRGPRIIVMGDSFTTATGSGAQALGFVNVFAEYMGWDDVWPSGIGGTGLISPGVNVNYGARVANDVFPFAPDELIIQGFFNDGSNTGAAVQAALTALITNVQANLPTCRITVVGPYVVNGSGYQVGSNSPLSAGVVAQRTALPAAVATFNTPMVRYLDPTSFGVPSANPQTVALTSSPASGATSFTYTGGQTMTAGQTFQFPDGSRCFVLSVAGSTATVDKVTNAQTAGAIITACPGCYLRGNGHVGATTGVGNADFLVFTDGIHPSATGHLILGTMFAQAYAASLNA